VLLKTPPPDVINHAPVEAPPPTLAPAKVIAVGVADWHAVFGPPAITVEAGVTSIVLSSVAAAHAPGAFEVRVSVTILWN